MSCTCHTGHPPCYYCTYYSYCEECGDETHNDDLLELNGNYLCENCYELKKNSESKAYKYLFGKKNERN